MGLQGAPTHPPTLKLYTEGPFAHTGGGPSVQNSFRVLNMVLLYIVYL